MNEELFREGIDGITQVDEFDPQKFLDLCREAQIKAGTYHADLERILPVLSMDPLSGMTHNNAAVHGYILRERERCAGIGDEILALFWHDTEDLDLPDGSGVSDHAVDFDDRCRYCRAQVMAGKIRSPK